MKYMKNTQAKCISSFECSLYGSIIACQDGQEKLGADDDDKIKI